MESGKSLYRRLAKQYHPDLAALPSEKPIHAKLMVEINEAHARGDVEALRKIDSMGLTYLLYKFYESDLRSHASEETPAPDYACKAPEPRTSSFWNVMRGILHALHPYSLLLVMYQWSTVSRTRKVFAFCVSALWSCVFFKAWGLIGVLSTWLVANGHPHESVLGLGVVLLRGVLLLVALPCFGPLCVCGLAIALFLTVAYFVVGIASRILVVFHPMLAYLPPIVAVPTFVWFGWAMLGDD